MSDSKALWKAIVMRPRDDAAKLALADWYEEHGWPRIGFALRWCVAKGKWPWPNDYRSGGGKPRFTRFSWVMDKVQMTRSHALPTLVYLALPKIIKCARARDYPLGARYYTCELAIRDLGDSLSLLRSICEVSA